MTTKFTTVIGGRHVVIDAVATDSNIKQIIQEKVEKNLIYGREDADQEDPFYMMDLGQVIKLYKSWNEVFPDVKPYYAVKSNPDVVLLKLLASLGVGFDCCSKNELKTILDLGVSPSGITFANPFKLNSYLEYARERNVDLMTFDCIDELLKIKRYYPSARLVLRLSSSAKELIQSEASVVLPDSKFGCSVSAGKVLLCRAMELGLNVVGVCFHVGPGNDGSGCHLSERYTHCIDCCEEIFKYGTEKGCKFTLLDIGGGFFGTKDSMDEFKVIASDIYRHLKKFITRYPDVKVIAEPGRYFSCSPYTLATCIVCKKEVKHDMASDSPSHIMYMTTDGLFGSFNKLSYIRDYPTPPPQLLKEHKCNTGVPSSFWGTSCAPDKFRSIDKMPVLDVGEWIFFENMGSYTISLLSSFCGFPRPSIYYYVKHDYRKKIENLLNSHSLTNGHI